MNENFDLSHKAMAITNTAPKYLLRWDHSRSQQVGSDAFMTPHRLCELPLFSKERLAQTLERHPAHAMSVYTMGTNPAHFNQWRSGVLGSCTGEQLLQEINHGRLILVLRDIAKHHQQYGQITQRLCGELIECHVGLRIHRPTADLVFASPATMQYYRCDHRPTLRWQILGQQTVRAYPATEKFIDPQTAQDLVVDQVGRSLYFQGEFDDHVTSFELSGGQMLSLPQPTPYRVQLGHGLNVWLQTQHDTQASYRRRNIYVANRVFRKILPESLCGTDSEGAWPAIKNLCTRVLGFASRYGNPVPASTKSTFVVQPNNACSIGSDRSKQHSIASTTGLVTETTAASAVLEK